MLDIIFIGFRNVGDKSVHIVFFVTLKKKWIQRTWSSSAAALLSESGRRETPPAHVLDCEAYLFVFAQKLITDPRHRQVDSGETLINSAMHTDFDV